MRRELDDLRGEVADLERKYGALLAMLTVPGEGDGGDAGTRGSGEDEIAAEWDGLRFMVAPGEDPEAKGRALRRALDKANGKFTFDDAG